MPQQREYQIGAGTRMIRLVELQEMWGLTPEGVRRNLRLLSVPVIETDVASEDAVSVLSLECAMLAALLPGGPGVWMKEEPRYTTSREALNAIAEDILADSDETPQDSREKDQPTLNPEDCMADPVDRVLPYWDLVRDRPLLAVLILSLAYLMYGSQDIEEVKRRLYPLGDLLIRQYTMSQPQAVKARKRKKSKGRGPGRPPRNPDPGLDFGTEQS